MNILGLESKTDSTPKPIGSREARQNDKGRLTIVTANLSQV